MGRRWTFDELNAARETRDLLPPAPPPALSPAQLARRALTAPSTAYNPARSDAAESTGAANLPVGFSRSEDIEASRRTTDIVAELLAFQDLFDRLAPKTRTVVNLRVQGLTSREVAARLGLQQFSIASYLNHARDRLVDIRAGRCRTLKPCRFCGSVDHDGRFHRSDDRAKMLAERAGVRAAAPPPPPPPAPAAAIAPPAPPPETVEPPTEEELDAFEESTCVAKLQQKAKSSMGVGRVRSRTLAPKRLTREEKRLSHLSVYPPDVDRPSCRAECMEMPRPCPFVSCSHHLYLDVNQETGAIKLNFPHLEVWEMANSCSLDVADRGGITLEEVGAIMNLTRERIRQVEVRGLSKIRDHGGGELERPAARGEGYEVRVPHRR